MKDFDSLDRQTQRNRLRQLGKAALNEYGISNGTLNFITDTENTVFQVRASDRTYALRIHSPDEKPASEVEGELLWLAALRRDTSLEVPEPVQTLGGHFVLEIETPDVPGPRPVVLFHWLPGEILGESTATKIDIDIMGRLGSIMAQLHHHAEGFQLPDRSSRPPWSERRSLVDHVYTTSGLSEPDLAMCIEAVHRSTDVIEAINTNKHFGLMHCDLHPWNCLFHENEISVIDFDDCRLGSFTEDIAITLTYFDSRPDYEALRNAFYDGYTQFRDLPSNYVAEVEAFMVSRGIGLITWVLGWPSLDHHPFGRTMLEDGLRRAEAYMAN
ncbi:phosphotransferase [Chloroflexi bacterium TSY]|nr:phosphotransferase [Chloroflexi bacterium TSY]